MAAAVQPPPILPQDDPVPAAKQCRVGELPLAASHSGSRSPLPACGALAELVFDCCAQIQFHCSSIV